jgi:cation diffusion facilitator CzcD-associated flavoprotein CzcO
MCSGYYRYDESYTPAFQGIEHFEGKIVHPQFWNDRIEYADKRVVVCVEGPSRTA